MALPRMERRVRSETICFYVTHEDDYDCSLQLMIDGEDAMVHTLNGKAFFRIAKLFARDIFPEGVKYLHFIMLQRTLEKLWLETNEVYEFKDNGRVTKGGREFRKVCISLK